MKSISVPSTAQQVSSVGFSKDYTTAGKLPDEVNGFIRVKNIGDADGRIRLYGHLDDGMVMSPGETEYMFLNDGENLEIVAGEFNIMF